MRCSVIAVLGVVRSVAVRDVPRDCFGRKNSDNDAENEFLVCCGCSCSMLANSMYNIPTVS